MNMIEVKVSKETLQQIYESQGPNFYLTMKSEGFMFMGKLLVSVGFSSSGEAGIISVTAHEAIPFLDYKGNVPAMYPVDHHQMVFEGKRERGYNGQIITVRGQKCVLVDPIIRFCPSSKFEIVQMNLEL